MNHVLFDAYGTLFDLSGALEPAKIRLADKADAVLDRWRVLQLDYAWLAALGKRYKPFEALTRMAFQDALAAEGIEDAALVDALSEAFRCVEVYPDVAEVLDELSARGHRAAILSNGSPDMLASAATHAGIATSLETILSVDVVSTFKPDPHAYAVGAIYMQAEPREIAFVSSNYWDVLGARDYGYRAIWLDRGDTFWPASRKKPEDVLHNMSDILDVL